METIKTKRFLLRTPKMSDAKDIAKNFGNKKVMYNLSNLPWPYEVKHAREYISKILKGLKKGNPQNYIMYIVMDGEVIGGMGLHSLSSGHKSEMGFWLAENQWGKGIMPEALKVFMKHAFKKFKLKRIYAKIYERNKGSVRVAEKLGMVCEGMEKKGALKDGKYLNCYVYAKVK